LTVFKRIIIGSDQQPETKQGIEGKIVRFRSGRVRDRVRVRDKDRRSEAINLALLNSDWRSEPNTVLFKNSWLTFVTSRDMHVGFMVFYDACLLPRELCYSNATCNYLIIWHLFIYFCIVELLQVVI